MRYAQPAAVHVRPACDARLRLEDAYPEQWNLRRPDLRQVHDVAGAGQRHLPETRGRLRNVEGPPLMRFSSPLPAPNTIDGVE
jgi:hypothetical protein